MRAKICVALVAVLLTWVIWDHASTRRAEAVPAPAATNGELMTLLSPQPDGGQQLIVIDPRVRTLSVYHVTATNGEVALKSVRNIHWDLQMSHFNTTGPTPQEIRTLLEQPPR